MDYAQAARTRAYRTGMSVGEGETLTSEVRYPGLVALRKKSPSYECGFYEGLLDKINVALQRQNTSLIEAVAQALAKSCVLLPRSKGSSGREYLEHLQDLVRLQLNAAIVRCRQEEAGGD